MLTILFTVLIGLPLLLLAWYRLQPESLLSLAETRVVRALKVEQYNQQSAYSSPGFLPVHTELQQVDIRVEGQIPTDFAGVYLRNGTNIQFQQTRSRAHMFNGAGMLHQVQVSEGTASYSNTYIRTPRFEANAASELERYPEFGDLAGGGKAGLLKLILDKLRQRAGLVPSFSDCENNSSTTAIQTHAGKLYCLQETGFPFALNLRFDGHQLILDGHGAFENFAGALQVPFTAHPKIDPSNGDWYTFSTELSTGKIHHSILSEGMLKNHSALFAATPAMAFLHDYYLTENFVVFPDVSMRFSGKELMGEHRSPFYFDPDYKMRFGVIKRDHQPGDDIQWFSTDQAGHIWHTINAWEETDADGSVRIVLFAPVFRSYPSDVPIHSPQEPHAYLHRYTLNLSTGEVDEQRQLLDHFYERPSFNTEYLGKKTRFAYLLDEQASGGIMGKGVLKYDLLEEREAGYFDYGDYYGGEALFVPKQTAEAEDDGYLVDLLMSETEAYLVIIDARTMQELAKLHLPQRVPYGVHACWISEDKLQDLRSD